MKPPHHRRRIDLAELKTEIVRKLGNEGSKQYFYYLSKLLNLKLSKIEFNKRCIRIVGRENIQLHNQFIHSILINACKAKSPPPKEALNSLNKQSEPNQSLSSNGYIRNPKYLKHSNSAIKLESGDLSRKQVHENEDQVSHDQNHGNVSKILQDKALKKSAFFAASSCSISGLLDNSSLRERMENIALIRGLEGVTNDCASLLNKGLDSYLKGLISTGVELVGARLGNQNEHQANLKLINGVNHGQKHHYKLGDVALSCIQEEKAFFPVSLLDFKAPLELNPQNLGEDWPLLMEKICTKAFSEK